MFEIKFSGESFEKVRLEIQEFAVCHLGAKFNVTEPAVEGPKPGGNLVDFPTKPMPTKKVAGRPKKTVEEHISPEEPPRVKETTVVFDESDENAPVTLEDAQNILRKVSSDERYGFKRALEVIDFFGVEKVRFLPKERYQEFVTYCKDLLNVEPRKT